MEDFPTQALNRDAREKILVEPQIFKILTGPQWALWRGLGTTLGSPDDRRDGFIHFSAAHQISGTLLKHFSAHDRLWIVAGDPARMGSALKWEKARNGQLFPHLYSPFSVIQATGEWNIRKLDGRWALPVEATT